MIRIGIDLGGTKIEGVALDDSGREHARLRCPAPRRDYGATLSAIVAMIRELETSANAKDAPVGIGMPGSISPRTGKVQNANSTWLNGQNFSADVEAQLGRPVICANDANCLALSEAADGAARGARIVFGVILGTGCGGGIVIGGEAIAGSRGIAGEWGHNPLPWPSDDETPGPACWCGRRGCLETWLSGPALAEDHRRVAGVRLSPEDIVSIAAQGDLVAQATLDRHASRLARGLASVVNTIDPDIVVLGGGLSQLSHLYEVLPALMQPHIFSDSPHVIVKAPLHGAASGVRGAARLTQHDGRPAAIGRAFP